ncbi:basic proline-rich protein-like [Bos javanicus]|uniref:basic proline-rich protein-like n=1 Tax=Bos taurus TaxID=9913 RepID=UPI0028CB9DD2|nr:basic proline-rich protein-like [Bos taurus]XP_061237569.1 basic proline-rich protein-like [Bos javanicus]
MLPSHPRTPHFRFRRGQRPRHSPAASSASPPPPPPPGSAVRPLRGSARPPHAPRPPRDARARPATLAFQPARGRCPQGRVARPLRAPIGSRRRARALRLARGAFLSFMRLTPPRPPPRALPFTVRPPPPRLPRACALTPATAATSRPDWLREQSAAPRENTRERARAGPSGFAGDCPGRVGVLRGSQKWGNGRASGFFTS